MLAQSTKEKNKQIQISMLAKAWSDPNFKARLEKDPTTVCREEGMDFSGEMRISDREASPNVFYLPPPPSGSGGMSTIEVEKAASEVIAADKEMF
jgi:hypothetical protein